MITTSIKTAPQFSHEIDSRVEDLLAKMTIREKLGQLNQMFSGRKIDERNLEDYIEPIRTGELGSFIWAMLSPSERNRLQREAVDYHPALKARGNLQTVEIEFPIIDSASEWAGCRCPDR